MRQLAVIGLLAALGGCAGAAPPPAASAPPTGTPAEQAAAAFFTHCAEPDPTKTVAEATRLGFRYGEPEQRREVLRGRAGHVFGLPPRRTAMLMLGEAPRACEVWVPEVASRDLLPPFEAGLGRLREAGASTSLVNRAESADGITRIWLVTTADRTPRLFSLAPQRAAERSFRSVLATTDDAELIAAARLQAR